MYIYVAGDCHKRDNANSNRDNVVYQIRKAGFRVEGLGRCMHTKNPEGISLPTI
jgi:cobalamin biosynthesis Co2+ chelatase CbiK